MQDEHGEEIPREVIEELREYRERKLGTRNDHDATEFLVIEFGFSYDVTYKIIAS